MTNRIPETTERTRQQPPPETPDSEKGEQEGATEDLVSDTPAPAGPLYDDEPKQG